MADAKRKDAKGQASPWEYVLGAIGALLVAATIGYLVVDARRDPGTPPDLTVTAETILRGTRSYVVELSVENRGSETAASVIVRGELKQGGVVIEEAETMLDYVPGHSSRPAGLVFTRDPRAFQLELRAVGYDVP